jgi:predicted histidine transporter YuiF (NhaC family)
MSIMILFCVKLAFFPLLQTNATVDPTTLLGNAKQTASVTFGSTSGINYENQTTSGEIKVTSPNGKTLYDTQKTTSQSGGR